jgi:hypothetical protein
MAEMNGRRVTGGLARLWVAGSAVFLLVVAAGILAQPGFPLGLGPIRTTGRAGLWLTLVPAAVGLAGVVLARGRGRLGPGLVFVYSAFWSLVLASGLPAVWNAKESLCLKGLGFCITSPWIGRLAALGVLTPFLLVGSWAWRRFVERGRTTDRSSSAPLANE